MQETVWNVHRVLSHHCHGGLCITSSSSILGSITQSLSWLLNITWQPKKPRSITWSNWLWIPKSNGMWCKMMYS